MLTYSSQKQTIQTSPWTQNVCGLDGRHNMPPPGKSRIVL